FRGSPCRIFQVGYCYHITTRCNNREFCLTARACRELLLYAIRRCQDKYQSEPYGLCIKSNHVHYLLEPVHRLLLRPVSAT
ncbi:MAG: transposase, partial [Cyanobacteria bacterium P01_A01_bin.17]